MTPVSSDIADGSRKQEVIRRQLRDRILSGHYAPGDPIPERMVAEELAVSRVPVREALAHLERDGLVAILPRRGAQVRQFSAENMLSLYEARESLEGMAARLTVERVEADYLASFKKQYEQLLDGSIQLDPAAASQLGNDFHEAIAKGSRNLVLIEMLGAIHDRVQLCRRLAYGQASPAWSRRAAEEHLNIASAIEQGDPDLAEQSMRTHVGNWARFLRSRMAGDAPHPSESREAW